MKYDIDTSDNHLILVHQDNRFLIDTGSPKSIAKTSEIMIFGQTYRVSQNYLGLTIDELSRKVGSDLYALIGGDVLKNHTFQIDFNNQEFCIFESYVFEDLEGINIDLFMGIPTIEIGLGEVAIRAFLDTGAPISYLNRQYLEGLNPIDHKEDFYPMFGRFKTPIYELPIDFASKEIDFTFGVLPNSIETVLLKGDTLAIIGNDIFRHFTIFFDYTNRKIYLRQEEN